MQVHRQHAVAIHRREHPRRHLRRDRHARRARAAILPGVAKIRHHRGDHLRRGALERVDQRQQLHEMLGGGRGGRLDHEHVLAADVFLDLDLHFAVGEAADQRLAHGHAQLRAHRLRERAVGVAAEDQQVFAAH